MRTISSTCVPSKVKGSASPVERLSVSSYSPDLEVIPAIELKSLLISKRDSLLSNASSLRSAKHLYYSDVDVLGEQVSGSCAEWRSFTSQLFMSSFTYTAATISFTSIYQTNSRSFLPIERKSLCSDTVVADAIVSLLSSGLTVNTRKTFGCSNSSWVIEQCDDRILSLCVDCLDPCSSNNETTAVQSFPLSPCASLPSEGSVVLLFSVALTARVKAPSISFSSIQPLNTTVRVIAKLSSRGSLHCAVFAHDSALPQSLDTVAAQNYYSTADPANVTSIVIKSLLPLTSYSLYCYSSYSGATTDWQQVVSDVISFDTMCCKSISVQPAATAVFDGSNTMNFFALVLDAAPSSQLQLSLVSNGSASLYPSSVTVDKRFSPTTDKISFSLRVSSVGLYAYSLRLSGPSAHEYSVNYGGMLLLSAGAFRVIGTGQEPPTPRLRTATFADSGSMFVVYFDSPTDQGRTSNSFPCSKMFEFSCSDNSKCRWVDSATIYAYVNGNTGCAAPGSSLRIQPSAAIKAFCAPHSKGCYSWTNVTRNAVIIGEAASPVRPTVVLSAPAVVGSCDDIKIDVGSSAGNGGRAWTRAKMSVVSSSANNISVLQNYLSTHYVVQSPPLAISYPMINKGFSYSFTVQLCNFLGACGESSVQVLAVDSIVPIVTIPGNALRQSVRGAILTISSSAAVSACGVVNTNAKLVYAWSIRESSVLSPLAVSSISRDPSKFILPAYSLRSNTYHTVSVSVSVENSAQSAKATTTVLVPVGGLYAVLSDGLTRSMRAGSSIVIDASSSYDEDVSVLTGTAAGLLFSWSCMQTAPVFNQSCNGLYTIATDAELLVTAEPASTGFAYQLTVQVSDSSGARQAQSSVALSVLSPAAALVHIGANILLGKKMNAGQSLQLNGSISVTETSNLTAVWSISESSIPLGSIALSPLRNSISASSSSYYLVIPPNSLPGRFVR